MTFLILCGLLDFFGILRYLSGSCRLFRNFGFSKLVFAFAAFRTFSSLGHVNFSGLKIRVVMSCHFCDYLLKSVNPSTAPRSHGQAWGKKAGHHICYDASGKTVSMVWHTETNGTICVQVATMAPRSTIVKMTKQNNQKNSSCSTDTDVDDNSGMGSLPAPDACGRLSYLCSPSSRPSSRRRRAQLVAGAEPALLSHIANVKIDAESKWLRTAGLRCFDRIYLPQEGSLL